MSQKKVVAIDSSQHMFLRLSYLTKTIHTLFDTPIKIKLLLMHFFVWMVYVFWNNICCLFSSKSTLKSSSKSAEIMYLEVYRIKHFLPMNNLILWLKWWIKYLYKIVVLCGGLCFDQLDTLFISLISFSNLKNLKLSYSHVISIGTKLKASGKQTHYLVFICFALSIWLIVSSIY